MTVRRSRLRRWTIEAKVQGSKSKFFRYKCEAASAAQAELRAYNALRTIWSITTHSAFTIQSKMTFHAKPAAKSWPTARVYFMVAPALLKLMRPLATPVLSEDDANAMLKALMLDTPNDTLAGLVSADAYFTVWGRAFRSHQLIFSMVTTADTVLRNMPPAYLEAAAIILHSARAKSKATVFNGAAPTIASATLRAAAQAHFEANFLSLRVQALEHLRAHGGDWLANDIEACHIRRARRRS